MKRPVFTGLFYVLFDRFFFDFGVNFWRLLLLKFKNSLKMKPERRHVCAYCGKKRIERNMLQVPSILIDNLPQGNFWACDVRHYSLSCVVSYLNKRAADMYAFGDKFKSAADKYKKYGKLS